MTMVRKLAALTTAWSVSARTCIPETNRRRRDHGQVFDAPRAPRQAPGIGDIEKPLIFNLCSKADF
jgi:hypothetical protein